MRKIIGVHGNVVILFLITFILYAPFSNKAFHMDSPVIVYGANQIIKDVIDPPLGEYGHLLSKWNKTGITKDSFYHATPHPPLVLLYLAPFVKIFGKSELVINWAMFPFYLFSVLFFYLFVRQFYKDESLWQSVLFVVSPAVFVNSQNVMLDTPLMSMVLASFYFLFKSDKKKDTFVAGLFAGLACLIKFTAGTLFFSALVYFIFKRDFKRVLYFFAPFILLNGLWLIHNIIILGKSQLISNEHANYILGDIRYRFERMISYIGGGWIFPFIPVILFLTIKDKVKIALISGGMLLPFSLFLIYKKSFTLVQSSFYLISVLSTILLIYSFLFFKNDKIKKEIKYALIVHFALQLIGGPFLTLYAVRYTLPFAFIIIIAFQMLLEKQDKFRHKTVYYIAIIISLTISISLAISDYQISGANRRVAKEVTRLGDKDQKLYFQGRLGYLYYMYNEGFTYFEKDKHQLKYGDLLLKNYYYSGDRELFEVAKDDIEKVAIFCYPLFNFVTKGGKSGFYGYDRLPYWYIPSEKSKREYTLFRYIGSSENKESQTTKN